MPGVSLPWRAQFPSISDCDSGRILDSRGRRTDTTAVCPYHVKPYDGCFGIAEHSGFFSFARGRATSIYGRLGFFMTGRYLSTRTLRSSVYIKG